MADRDYLLRTLDEALNCWDSRPWKDPHYDRLAEIRKFLRLPGRSILNTLLIRLDSMIGGGRPAIHLRARTFFGYPMEVLSLEHPLWLCGFKIHPGELRLTRFIIRDVKPDEVFLDVGAHHGFYTLLAHRLLEGGEIHAFEPVRSHFRILSRNAGKRGNIFANNSALYSREGYITFYENIHESSTIDKGFYDESEIGEIGEFKEIEVPSTTLDNYCREKGVRPTFLKLDVEGAEYDCLLGAQWTLETYSPKIVMEVWRSPRIYQNHLKAIDLLLANGYSPFRISSQGTPEPVSEIIPDRDIPVEEESDNFLFTKGSRK